MIQIFFFPFPFLVISLYHNLYAVLPSQAAAVAKGAHLPSLSKLNSAMEKAVPQLDMKLEKLNISSRCQPVIFPNHLQVPESFRSGLTFGSLDPHFDPSISCGKDSVPVETVPANDRTSMETGRSVTSDMSCFCIHL